MYESVGKLALLMESDISGGIVEDYGMRYFTLLVWNWRYRW